MNKLIENSPNKDFFDLLLTYQNPKAAALALEKLKATDAPAGHIMLKSWLSLSDYAKLEDLGSINPDFSKDYASEIAELGRLIDVLVSNLKHKLLAEKIAQILLEFLNQAGTHIENSARGYSQGGTIPANVWLDGAVVRDWALYLAVYYEDLQKFEQEMQMRFIRCKITNSIMNHYMHLVGPDMVGVGMQCYSILPGYCPNTPNLKQSMKRTNYRFGH